ncbi:MAG TPA: glycosyltransferase family 4 protein [Pyrinomonadaceae bacterium]|nr:glycosyltransferase family 4 protein [Pyrinomonadaceae bacterium]
MTETRTRRPLRLLTIAHSYCVALNRRLAHEMARAGAGEWEVTAVAPSFFHGDLRAVALERFDDEICSLEAVPAYFSKRIHMMLYGHRLREIMRQPWDMVHCWEEPFVLAGGQIARWTPKDAALVFATFQNIPKRYPPPFNWIERYSMKQATGWIAFGQTIDQALSKRDSYLARRRRLIPLGVDTDHFYPSPEAGEKTLLRLGWDAQGPPVIGFLGRFVPEKGLDLLTRVLDRLSSPHRVLFVGSGPMEKRLRDWAKLHDDRVRVVTGVKHSEVPAYLNAMDALCAPSRTMPNWREQLGRMLIEAFACGVPVVASDSGEIPYVVEDAGLVLSETDEDAWVSALNELLEDAPRRAELSKRGLERARTTYAWPVIARRHLDFFDELLDSKRPAQ